MAIIPPHLYSQSAVTAEAATVTYAPAIAATQAADLGYQQAAGHLDAVSRGYSAVDLHEALSRRSVAHDAHADALSAAMADHVAAGMIGSSLNSYLETLETQAQAQIAAIPPTHPQAAQQRQQIEEQTREQAQQAHEEALQERQDHHRQHMASAQERMGTIAGVPQWSGPVLPSFALPSLGGFGDVPSSAGDQRGSAAPATVSSGAGQSSSNGVTALSTGTRAPVPLDPPGGAVDNNHGSSPHYQKSTPAPPVQPAPGGGAVAASGNPAGSAPLMMAPGMVPVRPSGQSDAKGSSDAKAADAKGDADPDDDDDDISPEDDPGGESGMETLMPEMLSGVTGALGSVTSIPSQLASQASQLGSMASQAFQGLTSELGDMKDSTDSDFSSSDTGGDHLGSVGSSGGGVGSGIGGGGGGTAPAGAGMHPPAALGKGAGVIPTTGAASTPQLGSVGAPAAPEAAGAGGTGMMPMMMPGMGGGGMGGKGETREVSAPDKEIQLPRRPNTESVKGEAGLRQTAEVKRGSDGKEIRVAVTKEGR